MASSIRELDEGSEIEEEIEIDEEIEIVWDPALHWDLISWRNDRRPWFKEFFDAWTQVPGENGSLRKFRKWLIRESKKAGGWMVFGAEIDEFDIDDPAQREGDLSIYEVREFKRPDGSKIVVSRNLTKLEAEAREE